VGSGSIALAVVLVRFYYDLEAPATTWALAAVAGRGGEEPFFFTVSFG
jgi:hypothetical protein